MKRKIDAMWARYGTGPEGKTCGDCRNCVRTQPTDRVYWKCTQYGISGAESTDWVKKWPSCGCFGRDSGEIPMIEQIRHGPRTPERVEIEGQIAMDL